MSKKYQDTSNIENLPSSKPGLVTDVNPAYTGKENYSYARNLISSSKEGDMGTLGNEPSNILSFSASYPICGTVILPDGRILVFSGNGVSSEIGIGNPVTNTYQIISTLKCLNFSTKYPVTGVAKKDFNKGVVVTFTDKNNPVRRIEIDTISSVTSCDEIRLFKQYSIPCISVEKGTIGNIPNGTYSIAIAYSVDDNIFTSYHSITNRIALYSETGANSLEVKFDNLDTSFEEFAVIVVGSYIDPVSKGATKLAKNIGTFSTKIKSISISDFINDDYPIIKLSELVVPKRTWEKAGIITANSSYLILGDLVSREEENYQLKAMSIVSEYVVEQVPSDYYINEAIDVGYYRDENYDYSIQGVYKTGEFTDKFHIPGPIPTTSQRSSVSGVDVYEHDSQFKDCTPKEKIEKWQVENTAGKMIAYNNEFVCNRRTLGYGEMGVFLSTELYPDNEEMFGEWANTRIRYHKMPDECKVPRYSTIDGKKYINILGVRFKNIQPFTNPDIIGYRILRSDRKGGNGTVIARGLLTNVRWYEDSLTKEKVMYSNYPVNDLSPDKYISSTQTGYKSRKEYNFTPLKDYYTDKFNFYSPHTMFEPRYTLGQELKIETEEIATIKGGFEKVYNHPKQKLMNQFSFWLSAAVGVIESTIILGGKYEISTNSGLKLGIDGGKYFEIGDNIKIESFDDVLKLTPGQLTKLTGAAIKAFDLSKISTIVNLVTTVLQTISALALKPAYAALGGIKVATDIMETIRNLTGYTEYVYQYNCHASFDSSICVQPGNKRRRLLKSAKYISSDIVTVDGVTYNNYFREKTVLMELNKSILSPKTTDNSRNTISGFGICDDITRKVESVGSAFYATSKAINPNQYGTLGSAQSVVMHSCVLTGEETPTLFGGDCIISRFQFLKKMQFFNQNLANANFPDGTEYDYRLYRNIGYPRYWIDSTEYDFSELVGPRIVNFTKFSRTTSSKYNLDCKKSNDAKSISRIDDAYMYLSNNSVIDFFVECDYYIDYREEYDGLFYSKNNTNLSQIFRSDRLSKQEEFRLNRVYSDIYTTEVSALQQRFDFSETKKLPVNQENSVIYSLPSFNLQKMDNWQYFLPLNFFSFRESDFGTLTSIHKLDQDRLIFLFSKASPFISIGRDFLELEQSGRKITIGDGGLFAQDPREILPTDTNFGNCTSRYAFSNNHFGRFYPSQEQGRILSYTDNLDEISRYGMSYWCKNYMPIFLYKYFPEYKEIENPISGVGYLSVFDSVYENLYITKRDFSPKKEYIQYISWDSSQKCFIYKGNTIELSDSRYFNDISFTISYSPAAKSFVSFHDWHPDWVVQTENHFLSIKGNDVWKHNESYESFCNFYGIDYPFEVEFVSSSGQQIETVRNIEYLLEVYKYKNFGRNKFHVLNENFDRLIVYNTEQISPLLNLIKGNPNAEENLTYPKKASNISYDVTFFKEEQKYRVNQFWDTTKDRGEFSNSEFHLFPVDESGYKSVINPQAINIDKPEEERKKFRHYWNKFRLIKTVSGDKKFITKLLNIKKLLSFR